MAKDPKDKKDNKDKKDPENKKPKEDKKPKTVAEQAVANQKKAKANLSGETIGVGLKAKKMTTYQFSIPSDMEINRRGESHKNH